MWFTSDNAGPAAPEVMEALLHANDIYSQSYGNDEIMESVRETIRKVFEAPDAAVYLVGTGTTANALALACYCQPWQTIYCHKHAHINEDECGAPEFYTGGAKLTLLDGDDAKIDPTLLQEALNNTGTAGVHGVQKGVLSITNVTEHGAVYTVSEIEKLCDIAKSHNVPVHLDGARFANALVKLGCSPAEMTWKAGVDVISFGGTKNGLIGAEAVIFFDPEKAWEFELRRKRGGHLFSKHRYLSAQMDAYLKNDLWLDLANRANSSAAQLIDGLNAMPNAQIDHTADANVIFASWPRSGHRAAHEAGAKYYLLSPDNTLDGPQDEMMPARLVCNWATKTEDIVRFLGLISQ